MSLPTTKSSDGPFLALKRLSRFSTQFMAELHYGLTSGRLPWSQCFLVGTALSGATLVGLDVAVLERLGLGVLYPVHPYLQLVYRLMVVTSGVWFWGLWRVAMRQRTISRLQRTFVAIGLKNGLGGYPKFIFDREIDQHTRKLRLARNHISFGKFESSKKDFSGSLQVYIESIRENLETGTIDFTYSHSPLSRHIELGPIREIPKRSFVVGNTRSGRITESLLSCPHLLIAGQTGGGKSTFLRQFISSLHLNHPRYEFKLVDLKGGLEFQLFEHRPNISISCNLEEATTELRDLEANLEERMQIIRAAGVKDLESYLKRPVTAQNRHNQRYLPRQIVVVDEAAEIFLAGGRGSSGEIATARKVLSKIARQGRAVGIHLIIATQRPDVKSLDPQVKANLTGILCFQMSNDASSMTVLGNGRAKDLPNVQGRAVWRSGGHFAEVQTPFLSTEHTESLLGKK